MTLTLLVADDEPDVTTMLAYSARLLWPGCRVLSAGDGAEALRLFATTQPDLVVLDVGMPPPDGIAVCARLRAVSRVPILMLTAYGQTLDKVRAFDAGADDYLTKPFEALELLARLRALGRRAGLTPPSPESGAGLAAPLVVGGLHLDPLTRVAGIGDRAVALTATEYRLLEELARHAGRTLPHHYLLTQVWGPEYADDVPTLRVCVQRLRRRLGDEDTPTPYIQTERHIGYRLVPPAAPPP